MPTQKHIQYFNKFKEGDEVGLTYLYELLYRKLFWRSFRFVKEDIIADCVVQEAFLRLWISRDKMEDHEQVEEFLGAQAKHGCKSYYRMRSTGFHRGMLRLDEIEEYEEFIHISSLDDDEVGEEFTLVNAGIGEQQQQQWQQIQSILPRLPQDQQMFIQLCLKYSFSYDRIAWHLGGISDYEAAQKVERTLENLRSILVNTQKLNEVGRSRSISFTGDLSHEQANILHLRYELQCSFEHIAKQLNLPQDYIQKQFALARIEIKKNTSVNKNKHRNKRKEGMN